ncbi:MAG TPA: sulfotransferase family 2 domain-containing protein [Rhizomicrobium sp.]|nr:sulfotransferase family 2 domain-containing protein [Rhizomicrobium sp.]
MSPPRLMDPKRIHRLLFGVYYQEDIFEQVSRLAPLAMRALGSRVLEGMRRRNLIFLHVPRTGGTSITRALYGNHCIEHHSAACLKAMAPEFWNVTDSFAVMRDPFDRFASSYAFVRGGGTETCRLSDVFQAQTAHIRGVDDYLCFIEERTAFALDFVMRPQAWFVCDPAGGPPLVRRLFLYGRDQASLLAYLRRHGIAGLPWLNRSLRIPLSLSRRQKLRVEKIYAADFQLLDLLTARRAADTGLTPAAIAAE